MAMTRKQVKAFLEDPKNWKEVKGNDFVQSSLLNYQDMHIVQIQHRHDLNAWKLISKHDGYIPRIVWQGLSYWAYDPETLALLYSVSRTELENKIYERERV